MCFVVFFKTFKWYHTIGGFLLFAEPFLEKKEENTKRGPDVKCRSVSLDQMIHCNTYRSVSDLL